MIEEKMCTYAAAVLISVCVVLLALYLLERKWGWK